VCVRVFIAGRWVWSQSLNRACICVCVGAPVGFVQADLAGRRDLRAWRIVSIDPATARDLDDALSLQPLPAPADAAPDGMPLPAAGARWRVGIHIADVAAFVRPGSALDDDARARATTTYMVQRAVPMLPRLLCEVRRAPHPAHLGTPTYTDVCVQ
jgi:exoribonuclease R